MYNQKHFKLSIIMFAASTFAAIILVFVWQGLTTDYLLLFACLYGYGYTAHLFRQYLQDERKGSCDQKMLTTKGKLVRYSFISWIGSILIIEIIMYEREFPLITLLLFPLISILILYPIWFYSLRRYSKGIRIDP